ncbi:MAG: hypothetical protein JXR73_14205 [Candidatus Omnitrophica bacterium]|nr:hypothetical protein [Candidatus Omnitrophota bacterium]
MKRFHLPRRRCAGNPRARSFAGAAPCGPVDIIPFLCEIDRGLFLKIHRKRD